MLAHQALDPGSSRFDALGLAARGACVASHRRRHRIQRALTVTRDQALTKAREFALARGWTWLEPVHVEEHHAWWVGPLRWRVRTNDGCRGTNVWVDIDDQTGEVIKANFIPR
jgi:hypothetical protein